MLIDRVYMRGQQSFFHKTVCDRLIFVLITIFLIQSILQLFGHSSLLVDAFGFSISALQKGYIWTLLTYTLLHEGPMHLIFNLLGVHFIVRQVELLIGPRNFLIFIILCSILGSLFWLLSNYTHNFHLVGISALILGALSYFCLHQPDQKINLLLFFILPVSLKPKWILWATLGIEVYGFLIAELGGSGIIAHSAHLGGMFAGFVCFFIWGRERKFPIRFTYTKRPNSSYKTNFKVNFNESCDLKEETDRILDKINEQGFASLSESEKATLEKAKKMLNS